MQALFFVIIITSLVACGSSNNRTTPTIPTTTTPPPANTGPVTFDQETNVRPDLVRQTFVAADVTSRGSLAIDVDANDVSFLLSVGVADDSNAVLFTEIIDPSGETIYMAGLDNDEAPTVTVGIFSNDVLANKGTSSLILPRIPAIDIQMGRYVVSFMTENNVPITHTSVLIKSVDEGADIDLLTHELDMNVLIAHENTTDFNTTSLTSLIEPGYRDVIDRIGLPHNIRLGEVNISQASAADVASFTDLMVETEFTSACAAALAANGTGVNLNLVFVNTITSTEISGIAGIAPGLGPVTGRDDGTNACYFISQAAYPVSEGGLTQALSNELQSANILHEAGHFMGLPHTTESAGNVFDDFNDTPQCDLATFDGMSNTEFGTPIEGTVDGTVTDYECGTVGGANNFLFYGGVPEFTPFIMSAEQAWAIRRYPVARPE